MATFGPLVKYGFYEVKHENSPKIYSIPFRAFEKPPSYFSPLTEEKAPLAETNNQWCPLRHSLNVLLKELVVLDQFAQLGIGLRLDDQC